MYHSDQKNIFWFAQKSAKSASIGKRGTFCPFLNKPNNIFFTKRFPINREFRPTGISKIIIPNNNQLPPPPLNYELKQVIVQLAAQFFILVALKL